MRAESILGPRPIDYGFAADLAATQRWDALASKIERALTSAIADELEACIGVVTEMATDPGVDWFTGEALREAAKRLGFRRARSTEGDK
jgi:hypothetical protein